MDTKSQRILTKLKSGSKMSAFGSSKASSMKRTDSNKDGSSIGSSTLPSSMSLGVKSAKEIKKQQEKQIKLQNQLAKQEAKQQMKQLKLQQKQDKLQSTSSLSPPATTSIPSSGLLHTGESSLTTAVSSAPTTSTSAVTPFVSTAVASSQPEVDPSLEIMRNDESRFIEGRQFRGKLIGIEPVMTAKSDSVCQAAFKSLRLRRTSSGHKQKILINAKLSGVQLLDAKTKELVANHANHLISYITRDAQDERSFGYIYGTPEIGHQFIAIKCEKSAKIVLTAIGELFTYVYNQKKKEKQEQMSAIEPNMTSSSSIVAPSVTTVQPQSIHSLQPIQPQPMQPQPIQPQPIQSHVIPNSILQPITVNLNNNVNSTEESNSKETEVNLPVPETVTAIDRPSVAPSINPIKTNSIGFGLVPPPPPPRNLETLKRPIATNKLIKNTSNDESNLWKSIDSINSENGRFANWQVFNNEEDQSTLNRTNSLQSHSSNVSRQKNTSIGFIDSFGDTDDWSNRSPPKEPPPMLENHQFAEATSEQLDFFRPSVMTKNSRPEASSTLPRLSTPPSSGRRRRPRRTSDSYRSNSSSLADTSMDNFSITLDDDESSTLRLQQGDSSSDLNSSTLCMSSQATSKTLHQTNSQLARNQSNPKVDSIAGNESRCTSKLDSCSSAFSVSSFGTPSPKALNQKSPGKVDFTCEVITAKLQNLSAKLENSFNDSNQGDKVQDPDSIHLTEAFCPSLPLSWVNVEQQQQQPQLSKMQIEKKEEKEDKYAIFNKPEILQSTSIFDPLINKSIESDFDSKTDHKQNASLNDSGTVQSIQSNDSSIERSKEDEPVFDGHRRKSSIKSDISTSLNLSSLSLLNANVFEPTLFPSLDPVVSLLNRTSEALSTLEKQFERSKQQLQSQQKTLNKQHLQQQQKLLQQQKQMLIEFNRQFKQRLQSPQPPQVIVTARAQHQLQLKRIQQQFVQQQQMLKQMQQTQQMQLLDHLQTLQQSYLERKSVILASSDSNMRNDEDNNEDDDEEEAAAQIPNIFQAQPNGSMFGLNEGSLSSMLHLLGLDSINPNDSLDTSTVGDLSLIDCGFQSGSSPLMTASAPSDRCSTSCSIASNSSHNPFLLSEDCHRSKTSQLCGSGQSLDPLNFSHNSTSGLFSLMNNNRIASRNSSQSEDALSFPYSKSTSNDHFVNKSCNATFESLMLKKDTIEGQFACSSDLIKESKIGQETEDPFNCNYVDNKLNEISRISQIRQQTQRQLLPITVSTAAHSPPGSMCATNPPMSPFVADQFKKKPVQSSSALSSSSTTATTSTMNRQTEAILNTKQDSNVFDPFALNSNKGNSFSALQLNSLLDLNASKKSNTPMSASTIHLPLAGNRDVQQQANVPKNSWFDHFGSDHISPPERNIFQVKKDPFDDDFFFQ